MAITTYRSFIDNLGDLSITGIVRALDAPPASVETADLPCSFPRAVEGTEGPMTVQTAGGWPEFTGELVMLVETVGQNTVPENHSTVVDLADNFSAAIRAIAPSSSKPLGKGALNWSLTLSSNEIVGERQYWALIARVEGSG